MAKKNDSEEGITIEFMSRGSLEDYNFQSKLDLIMEKVKNDEILVLEEALTPEEKRKLIEQSMEEIEEDFPGIEFSGFDPEKKWYDKILNFLKQEERRDGLLVVGSSKVLEKIKEERGNISLLAKLKE